MKPAAPVMRKFMVEKIINEIPRRDAGDKMSVER
jgi:hypothetical protein